MPKIRINVVYFLLPHDVSFYLEVSTHFEAILVQVTAAKKILMNVVNWGPTSRCLCRSSASHILRRSLVEIRRRRVRQAATYATGVYMCGYTDTVKWDEEVIEIEASVTPSLYEKWKGGRGQSSMELLSQRGVTGKKSLSFCWMGKLSGKPVTPLYLKSSMVEVTCNVCVR